MPVIRWVWNAWKVVWDHQVEARTLNRLRIGVGLLYVAVFLSMIPNAKVLYDGELGLSVKLMRSRLGGWRLDWFDGLVGWEVYAVIGVGAVASALFAAGVVPKLAGAVIYLCHIGMQYRCFTWMDGSDDLIRTLLAYLWFVPWSRSATTYPGWPLRLCQIQVAVMYLATAVWKSGGNDWLSGTALYWGLSDPRWQRFPTDLVTGTALGQGILQASTWAALGLEYALPVILFWPRTRRLAVYAGVALHAGILATMVVGLFTPVVLVSYLAFWEGELPLVGRLRRRAAA